MSEQDVKAAAERLLGAAREVITDEQHGDEYADGIGYLGFQADLVTVAQFALEAADRQAALAAELGRLKALVRQLVTETHLEYQERSDDDYTPMPFCVGCGSGGWGDIKHSDNCPAAALIAALDTTPAEAGE